MTLRVSRPRTRIKPNAAESDPLPEWFTAFLRDRETRTPSAHTIKAYRQDFVAIASLVAGGDPARMPLTDNCHGRKMAHVDRRQPVVSSQLV
jgi:hypothetical protein